MRGCRILVTVAIPLLLLSSCTLTILSFDVPGSVVVGSTFDLVVRGDLTNEKAGQSGGAVLQIPNGFVVVSAWSSVGNVTMVKNDPALLANFQAEPGHYLVSYSALYAAFESFAEPIILRVKVRAPSQSGTHMFKVAAAGTVSDVWQITDPVGVGNFALITSLPYAVNMGVVQPLDPTAPIYSETLGLPWFDKRNWSGVAFADVTNDGNDDVCGIARLDNGPHYFSRVGGRFQEFSSGLSYSFSGRSDVAFGDFNGDGFLDLADGNSRAWLGDGGTSWTPATNGINSSGGTKEGVAVGDVNNDGFDDVAFSGHFDGTIQCFLSKGNGTWVESSAGLPSVTSATDGGHKLLMGDFNGDMNLDIVWTRFYKPNIWFGDGMGGWIASPASGLPKYQFWGVDAADFDGDGDLDLVFGLYDSGPPSNHGGIEVYENLGSGTFGYKASTGLPSYEEYQDVALADFDRDGFLDIVAGRSYGSGSNTQAVEVWGGVGFSFSLMGSFGLPYDGMGSPEGIAVGDVNGDTWPDIGVASYGMGLLVYVNDRTGFSTYGEECGGVTIHASGSTQLGTSFSLQAVSPYPFTPAVLLLGISAKVLSGQPVLPLDLAPAAPDCTLLVGPSVLIGLSTDGIGQINVPGVIPALPHLAGVTAFAQFAVASAANPLGWVFSDGGAVQFAP